MSLFKRGDVYWSYFYRDGVRHQYSTGTPNRKQAGTIEAKLKEDINKQRFQIAQSDPPQVRYRVREAPQKEGSQK